MSRHVVSTSASSNVKIAHLSVVNFMTSSATNFLFSEQQYLATTNPQELINEVDFKSMRSILPIDN